MGSPYYNGIHGYWPWEALIDKWPAGVTAGIRITAALLPEELDFIQASEKTIELGGIKSFIGSDSGEFKAEFDEWVSGATPGFRLVAYATMVDQALKLDPNNGLDGDRTVGNFLPLLMQSDATKTGTALFYQLRDLRDTVYARMRLSPPATAQAPAPDPAPVAPVQQVTNPVTISDQAGQSPAAVNNQSKDSSATDPISAFSPFWLLLALLAVLLSQKNA